MDARSADVARSTDRGAIYAILSAPGKGVADPIPRIRRTCRWYEVCASGMLDHARKRDVRSDSSCRRCPRCRRPGSWRLSGPDGPTAHLYPLDRLRGRSGGRSHPAVQGRPLHPVHRTAVVGAPGAAESWWPFAVAGPADTDVAACARAVRDDVDVTVGIGERPGCRASTALYGDRVDEAEPADQDASAVEDLATSVVPGFPRCTPAPATSGSRTCRTRPSMPSPSPRTARADPTRPDLDGLGRDRRRDVARFIRGEPVDGVPGPARPAVHPDRVDVGR